jgi:SAM-dependent methyltransferase
MGFLPHARIDAWDGAVMAVRASGARPYLFPRHPSEPDRLDVQHYALNLTVGANYVAPIGTPERVLDTGCGTGQWAYDLCRDFPNAVVVGLDLQPSKPVRPANFRFQQGDLLDGLPFADGEFDFVHQRFLVPGVPLDQWDDLIAELMRVARPGGWIELVELAWTIEPAGRATRRLMELASSLGRSLGLDTGSVFRTLDHRLRRAGAIDVERRTVDIPLGEWGGRTGSLMASDYRAAAMRLTEAYPAKFGIPPDECQELIRTAWREWDELESRCTFAFGIGRKGTPRGPGPVGRPPLSSGQDPRRRERTDRPRPV